MDFSKWILLKHTTEHISGLSGINPAIVAICDWALMGDHYSILPKEVNEERKLNCQTKHKTPKLEKQAYRNIKKKSVFLNQEFQKILERDGWTRLQDL